MLAMVGGLCVLPGCSGNPHGADVSGVVTLDGERIGPGVVIFSPEDSTLSSSRGTIDTGGRYHLVTKHDRGVAPGSYQVAVQVYDNTNPPAPGERQWESPAAVVPEKYLKVATSGLKFDVDAGSNTIDISLTAP